MKRTKNLFISYPQQVRTRFKDYKQIFPKGLAALNEVYGQYGCIYNLEGSIHDSEKLELFERIKSSRELDIDILNDIPETEDHFKWNAGIELSSGKVVALFPYSSGSFNDHVELRRSIGIYVQQGIDNKEIDHFVEELILGILDVRKRGLENTK